MQWKPRLPIHNIRTSWSDDQRIQCNALQQRRTIDFESPKLGEGRLGSKFGPPVPPNKDPASHGEINLTLFKISTRLNRAGEHMLFEPGRLPPAFPIVSCKLLSAIPPAASASAPKVCIVSSTYVDYQVRGRSLKFSCATSSSVSKE